MSTETESRIIGADADDKICRRCGRTALDSRLSVSEDTLKEYFRCMLGNVPFKKTFNVFDGKISITFSTLTNEQEQLVLNYDKSKPLDAAVDTLMFRLMLGLDRIEVRNPDTLQLICKWDGLSSDVKSEILTDPVKAAEKLGAAIDPVMLQLVRRCHITFMVLVTTILESMVDQNFYEGVGLL